MKPPPKSNSSRLASVSKQAALVNETALAPRPDGSAAETRPSPRVGGTLLPHSACTGLASCDYEDSYAVILTFTVIII